MSRAVKQGVFRDGNGAVVTTARAGTVSVFLAGTTTPADIYTASIGGTAVHSVVTDGSGRFKVYIDYSVYSVGQKFDIVLSGTGINSQTYQDELVYLLPYTPYEYDALLYGANTYTQATIQSALTAIGTTNKATLLLRPGNWVILTALAFPANVTVDMPTGSYFSGAAVTAGTITGLRDVTPDMFGPLSVDMTVAVQAAFNSGANVKFSRSYPVVEVTIGALGQKVDFNGYSLTGIHTGAAASAPLNITGRSLTLYNVSVNANYKDYNSVVHWYSVPGSGFPAQFNTVYGMSLNGGIIGLLFGALPGGTVPSDPQSENTIYSLETRNTQIPFVGNQTNGFLTLVAPILDCYPYEWSSQPGYNATTFNTASRVFKNLAGSLTIFGGEGLKQGTQLGYGIEGAGFSIYGTYLEVAAAQFYLTGSAKITDVGSYFSNDAATLFTIDVSANGTLTLSGNTFQRPVGTAAYSGAKIVNSSDGSDLSSVYTVDVHNSKFIEWWSSRDYYNTASAYNYMPNINTRLYNTEFVTNLPSDVIDESHNPKLLVTVPLSFETAEQMATNIVFPELVTITKIRAFVTKALAATDNGTITGANTSGASAGGVITIVASTPLATGYAVIPTTNMVVQLGYAYTLTTAKTTAGGKVLVILEYRKGL